MQNRSEGTQVPKKKNCSRNLQLQSLVFIKSMILLKSQGVKTNRGKFEDFLGIEKIWWSINSWNPNRSTVQVPKKFPPRQKEWDQLKEQVASNFQKTKEGAFSLNLNIRNSKMPTPRVKDERQSCFFSFTLLFSGFWTKILNSLPCRGADLRKYSNNVQR